MSQHLRDAFQHRLLQLQSSICKGLEAFEPESRFVTDAWVRPEGGGGSSRVLEGGQTFAKGGVNFSAVSGELPDFLKREQAHSMADDRSATFFATGRSLVIHPVSPRVPIVHMNIRYFETNSGVWWFGGGIDLTPIYIVEEDAQAFHRGLKDVCDRHPVADYAHYSKWAEDYFTLPHRNETRGIGGIFFDRLKGDAQACLDFTLDVGEAFLPLYSPIVAKHRTSSYGEQELAWQALRRGRYVEFNLVNDRGTRFGLETNGRTESILMSLPPLAQWRYNHLPEPGTPEAETLFHLQNRTKWH